MSRVKDQFHSEIIANSADAEWERALDESLAEQYPNYGEKGKSLELHQVEVKERVRATRDHKLRGPIARMLEYFRTLFYAPFETQKNYDR